MTERLPSDLRWIAFDLDDTLHEFKRASGRASEVVFTEIERQFGVGVEELREAYQEVLVAARSSHFSQPRTSREYRGERFGALLARLIRYSPEQLDRLLGIYDEALARELELKPGALEVLAAARGAGLSVMVISEGPHDAQATTIERLGIAPLIDLLITSAGEQVSKSDGLFQRALERAGCEPHQMLYVGDSLDRDIIPTSALGVPNVYVGDEGSEAMDLLRLAGLLDGYTSRV